MKKETSPSIGVKFCGGCNPSYNRRSVFDRLRRDYPRAVIRFLSEAPELEEGLEAHPNRLPDDLAIILCGCRNECLDYSRYVGKHGQLLVFSEEDYRKIEEFMAAWSANTP